MNSVNVKLKETMRMKGAQMTTCLEVMMVESERAILNMGKLLHEMTPI